MEFLRFLWTSIVELAGKILIGIGLFFVLGGIAAQIWVVVGAGILLMVIGFFLMPTD